MRSKMEAATALVEAAGRLDPAGVAEAEAALAATSETRTRRRSTVERRAAMVEMVEGRGTVWPTPFGRKFNDLMAGGLRPGQFTVLAGHSAHGKSALLSQLLAFLAARGARCALYTNEMEASEIDARDVARQARVPFMRLVTGHVGDHERGRVDEAIRSLGSTYTLIEAAGMTADEVAYDIRRERWDVCGVDLLNGLPASTETKDIDRNVATLAAASRQAGSHVIGAQHLNQSRYVGKLYPPEPAPADIRGSGGIYNLANNVLFVYLQESEFEPGEPSTDGVLKVAKCRGGVRGRSDVVFDPHKLSFLEAAMPGMVGSVAA